MLTYANKMLKRWANKQPEPLWAGSPWTGSDGRTYQNSIHGDLYVLQRGKWRKVDPLSMRKDAPKCNT